VEWEVISAFESLSFMLYWPLQSGVSKGSMEEIYLQQQAQIWELVSVLYSDISREPPLARRLEGKLLHYTRTPTSSMDSGRILKG
jgi:hypothetical protein